MNFIDEARKAKDFMPSPTLYQKPSDWNQDLSSYQSRGSPNMGKFLKGERVT